MATVVADMSMSLDGFVAGPDDEVDEVFSGMTAGDVTVESENPDLGYEVEEASAEELQGPNVKALVSEGVPYFAGLETTPVKLARSKVVEGNGVAHLHFEVER